VRVAWLLNLDADDELADPENYVRSRTMSERVREYARHAVALADADDVVLDEGAHAEPARGTLSGDFIGQAWCPTPRALAALQRAGARLPLAPSLDVLRRVNSRQFAAQLLQPLDGARYVTSLEELETYGTTLSLPSARVLTTWVFKSAFGFAGRGQKRLRFPVRDASTRRWLAARLATQDGGQLEPWVERLGDFGLHGWIEPGGAVRLGSPTVQTCDARGVWRGSRLATQRELDEAEHAELFETTQRAARALSAAGYFGPFGVDAYRWFDAHGGVRFNPCSEINARYSMGWRVGMHGFRPH